MTRNSRPLPPRGRPEDHGLRTLTRRLWRCYLCADPTFEELSLHEDHEGFGQDAVVLHRLRRPLSLHGGRESVHVGNVHEQCNVGRVLRVDERPDVGDTERPKEFFSPR